jgi:preprotein translocase subunit SecE
MAKVSTIKSSSSEPSGYFQSIVAEGKKIAWPTMPQILANTIIVVVLTVIFSTLLWALDTTFRSVIGFITSFVN